MVILSPPAQRGVFFLLAKPGAPFKRIKENMIFTLNGGKAIMRQALGRILQAGPGFISSRGVAWELLEESSYQSPIDEA